MFATAIHADVPFTDLREHLGRTIADWKVGLDARGFITGADAEDLRGEYEILPPETYAGRPWHRTTHPCPVVGPLAGYLHWSAWEDLTNSDMPYPLLRACYGVTARLDDDRTLDVVTLLRTEVSSALDKFGFDDGNAMLTHDEGPYRDHVHGAIHEALEAAGLSAHLSWMSTAHNPVRLSGWQPAGSDRILDALWDERGPVPCLVSSEEALDGIWVEVWGFDWKRLDDCSFWV